MANEQTSVPLYAASEVLTAANMNISAGTGVPVFATTVTRDAAFGGASEKVLAEGQLCYLSSTNVVQYYDGAAWATLGPTASKIAQVLSAVKTDTFTTSSTTYVDVTSLSVAITPTLNTSKILVFAALNGAGGTAASVASFRLVRDSTAISVGDTASNRTSASGTFAEKASSIFSGATTFLDSPATTSSTTYKIQLRTNVAATAYINRSANDSDSADYSRTASSITVMEVLV